MAHRSQTMTWHRLFAAIALGAAASTPGCAAYDRDDLARFRDGGRTDGARTDGARTDGAIARDASADAGDTAVAPDAACTTATRCGSDCVDLQTDPLHCGSCENVCPTGGNARAGCIAGRCTLTCNALYGDCDTDAGNGCELSLSTDSNNCGNCGRRCAATGPNVAASCTLGVCSTRCASGYVDCNANVADGCEVACAPRTNSTARCSVGACAYACNAYFGDCDANPLNGCETSLNTTSNCGRCGTVCNAGALPHGTVSCTLGACRIACSAGYGNCDGTISNGCETLLNSSPLHCGACGVRCDFGKSCCAGRCRPNC